MTKGELVRTLETVPDDFEVILSSDAEGNSFSPLSGVDWAKVDIGALYDRDLEPDFEEEDNNCIVLWPV